MAGVRRAIETLNSADFEPSGVPLVNPWGDAA